MGDMAPLGSRRGVLLGMDPEGLSELRPEMCSGK